jgi:hypothetical protein
VPHRAWNKIQDEYTDAPLWKRKYYRRRRRGVCLACSLLAARAGRCEAHHQDHAVRQAKSHVEMKVKRILGPCSQTESTEDQNWYFCAIDAWI